VDVLEGRLDVATERLRQAIAQIDTGEPTPELATALAVLGRVLALGGETDDALPVLERALGLAERFARPEVFVEALISKAIVYLQKTRLREARLLVEAAAAQSREEQLGHSEMRALNNLAVLSENLDRFIDTPDATARLIELARRRGDGRWEESARAGRIVSLFMLGRWDEAMTSAEELEQEVNEWDRSQLIDSAHILVERGEVDAAADWVSAHAVFGNAGASTLVLAENAVRARVLRAQRKPAEALAVAESVIEAPAVGPTDTAYKSALVEGIEAAFELGDLTRAEALLGIPESLERGMVTPFLRAHAWRFRARLDAARERHEGVDERFRQATDLLREFGFAFYVAVAQLEHAEWLVAQGRGQEAAPLLAEARATFEELRARPWLERAAAMAPPALAASAE
jgi:tetratricopeptide (TPR) repeat protein